MVVRCIDDRKSRKIIRLGEDYEALVSDENNYRLIFSEEMKKARGLSSKYQNIRFSKKRFIVIEE